MTLHHICCSDPWALVKVFQCGCRINTDRFPKWSPKAHASREKVGGGGTEHAPPGNVLFFISPGSPFLGIMSHSDKILARSIPFSSDEALQIGELLSLSLKMPRNWKTNCPNHLPDFNLQCFKTEEWIISFISHHCNVLFSNIFILKNVTCFPKLN